MMITLPTTTTAQVILGPTAFNQTSLSLVASVMLACHLDHHVQRVLLLTSAAAHLLVIVAAS